MYIDNDQKSQNVLITICANKSQELSDIRSSSDDH